MVQSSIDAMVEYSTNSNANQGGSFITSQETGEYVANARKAMADFMGFDQDEIAFGPNMTTLTFSVSRALARNWKEGDEIVVTELDHRANVDPWRIAAEEHGVTIRWIRLDIETFTLDLSDLSQIINEKTKLVAIGHASNGVGTINDVRKIAERAKEVGALVAVDAVHSAPHVVMGRDELLADMIFCSAYKFFGPHVGIVGIRTELFETLDVYRLNPAPSDVPGKLETGTANHEGIAALIPTIDFLASLGEGETRREKIISAFSRIEEYEDMLADKLRNVLSEIPEIKMFQAEVDVRKTPTIAFRIDGHSPKEICKYLAEEHSVFAGDGHFYAETIGELLELNNQGGWVRTGMAPYTSVEDVDKLINGIKQLIEKYS
ncbi:MAG: putative cysteine desulfurase [Candidatus Heimdallarchaeota archaeon LC_2]|nr:MAG: putative cysteine desulfurase [Candidatus Heimdallarchaeota archaeon LC_2]